MPTIFPFTAIVGQERMLRALILNAINPRIGGVLIRGERGTAKSTAARALAALLPKVHVVSGCRFSCDPSLPLSWCTECKERAAKNGSLPEELKVTPIYQLTRFGYRRPGGGYARYRKGNSAGRQAF